MKTYQWAVLGCGQIAGEMAQAMLKKARCFAGVASRSVNRAGGLCQTIWRGEGLSERGSSVHG